MTIKYRVLSLVVLSCLAGCKKDIPITDNSPIVIGEPNKKLTIVTYDKPIKVAPSQGASSYILNMDNDFMEDLEFTITRLASPGGVNITSADVKVLNPTFQIAVTDQIDSVFACTYSRNDTVLSETFYTLRSGFMCSKNGLCTLSHTKRYVYPTVYSKGQTMPSSTIWTNSSLYLSYYDQSSSTGIKHFTNQSVLLGNWNKIQLKYLVFKITTETETKYGWIQLSMNQYYEIELHGYAIQK